MHSDKVTSIQHPQCQGHINPTPSVSRSHQSNTLSVKVTSIHHPQCQGHINPTPSVCHFTVKSSFVLHQVEGNSMTLPSKKTTLTLFTNHHLDNRKFLFILTTTEKFITIKSSPTERLVANQHSLMKWYMCICIYMNQPSSCGNRSAWDVPHNGHTAVTA